LAKDAWSKAYVWGYPSLFTETFCITAKEAQLSGTPIVCSNIAALQTTVGAHGTILSHDPYSREGRVQFIEEVIKLHKDKDYWMQRRAAALEGAYRLDWQSRWEDYWSKYIN